jgi:hypothetical protein
MSDIDDYITNANTAFPMPGATTFTRLRAQQIQDPYNPSDISENWDNPKTLTIHGALASSSSRRSPDALREQTTSNAYLTVNDPDADVKLGDRIRPEPDDGRLWEVTGFPSNNVNAFTGWQPTLEIQLSEWKG